MAPPTHEARPIREDLRLQRWIWRCERLGWALLGLLISVIPEPGAW